MATDFPMPDLSGYTEEERRHLESVFSRQQQLQREQQQIMDKKKEEMNQLERTIAMRSEQLRKAGYDLNSYCVICTRTKFEPGMGHICNYCRIRCCAKCGGKVTLRSNKVIWVCILCRKKQEFLSSSGDWISQGMLASRDTSGSQRGRTHSIGGDNPRAEKLIVRRQYSSNQESNQGSSRLIAANRKYDSCGSYGFDSGVDSYMTSMDTLHRTDSSSMNRQDWRMYSGANGNARSNRGRIINSRMQRTLPHQSFSSSDDEWRSFEYGSDVDSERSSFEAPWLVPDNISDQKIRTNDGNWYEDEEGNWIGKITIHRKEVTDYDGSPGAYKSIGLKIVGGTVCKDGIKCAFIENVRKGSIADVKAGLKRGDEVVKWNGRRLRGKSYQEVYEIIQNSKNERDVELEIYRVVKKPSEYGESYRNFMKERPSLMVTSPSSPGIRSFIQNGSHLKSPNRILIKLFYDAREMCLVITAIMAIITRRADGSYRNVYAKFRILPEIRGQSKKRTKAITDTCEPRWDSVVVYTDIKREDLQCRTLEIVVWDYLKICNNQLVGEVRIDLASANLMGKEIWWNLAGRDEFALQNSEYYQTAHLSPSSTLSRHSDSDASDFDDSNRRLADGASLSSFGSSNSSPMDYEQCERGRRTYNRQYTTGFYVPPSHNRQLNKQLSLDKGVYSNPYVSPPATMNSDYISKSPQLGYNRSLSPPAHRAQSYTSVYSAPAYSNTRDYTRSAMSTPVTSPMRRRQLPKIPANVSPALKERLAQDLELRGFTLKDKKPMENSKFTGWNRSAPASGYSEGDSPQQNVTYSQPPQNREFTCNAYGAGKPEGADTDDSNSIDGSTYSTQSDRPQKNTYSDYAPPSRENSMPESSNAPNASRGQMNAQQRSMERNPSNDYEDYNDEDLQEDLAADIDALVDALPDSLGDDDCSPINSTSNQKKGGKTGAKKKANKLGPAKSSSSTQLSATDVRRNKKSDYKFRPNIKEYRSEEVCVKNVPVTSTDSSPLPKDKQIKDNFIGGGPGQVISRELLGSQQMGRVELAIKLEKEKLVVQVICAKNLYIPRTIEPIPPACVAKLYLTRGAKCVEKLRAKGISKSLNPEFNQTVMFKEPADGCNLHITIWGKHGLLEKRKFMGNAQINLNDLDLHKDEVVGSYKLFPTPVNVAIGGKKIK